MGEEVKTSEYEANGGGGGEDERVLEWEMGLPFGDDLTPLSQCLIPPELASAFSISPEPHRSLLDVNRASRNTLSSLRGGAGALSSNNFKSFAEYPMVVEAAEENNNNNNSTADHGSGSDARKMRKIDSEEADSALRTENSTDDPTARTLKRPRLVWTPQLHKRFVDVVAHLGIKNAVPKTIMQLMNVEGLTRENVASHLQKYRLYLKRMQGLSNEGPSSSDHLFASTPVPQSLHENGGSNGSNGGGGGGGHGNGNANANGHMGMPIPVPYHPGAGPTMMPMPVYGHMVMPQMGSHHHHHHQNGFEGNNHHVPYNMMQQRDWSGNNFGYHQVARNNNM